MTDNPKLEAINLTGGKRTNITTDDGHWWTGHGKYESCQFEGPWLALAVLAAKILRHSNTQKVAPNLYLPEIAITAEQEGNY